jgi:hypothetical protein
MRFYPGFNRSISYLVENGVINVCHEELKIASLCMGYLALPGFEGILADSSVEDLLKIGYYAFVDYAACYWTSHLRAGIAYGVPEQCTGKFMHHLQRFIDSRYRPGDESIQIPVPTRILLNCLQVFECDRFEDFLRAFVATERQVEAYGEGAASNDALDIPNIISRIRTILEDAAVRESWDEVDRKLFTFFYGKAIYKCPRMSCSYFHRGFTSATERETHNQKHTLPYSCCYPGCLRVAVGFSSPNELQRHISQVHEIGQSKERKFPLKQKRPILQCGICQRSFTKPGQLRTHSCRQDNSEPRPVHRPANLIMEPDQQISRGHFQNVRSYQDRRLAIQQAQQRQAQRQSKMHTFQDEVQSSPPGQLFTIEAQAYQAQQQTRAKNIATIPLKSSNPSPQCIANSRPANVESSENSASRPVHRPANLITEPQPQISRGDLQNVVLSYQDQRLAIQQTQQRQALRQAEMHTFQDEVQSSPPEQLFTIQAQAYQAQQQAWAKKITNVPLKSSNSTPQGMANSQPANVESSENSTTQVLFEDWEEFWGKTVANFSAEE